MKIAILGLGSIAHTMAKTIVDLNNKDFELYACASRTQAKADAFAKKYAIKAAYGSYEDMVKDANIDLVYIASPHSEHYAHAKLCLMHNKNILVEKAFCANLKQTIEIINLGKAKNLLVAEAIWTRYMPSRQIISEAIYNDLGKVRTIHSNLSYNICNKERIKEPALAGGALLDIGIYPLNFTLMFFNDELQDIKANCIKNDKGVDLVDNISLIYKDGKYASAIASTLNPSDRLGFIYAEDKYLKVTNINNPEAVELFDKDHNLIKTYELPKQVSGYEYQLFACKQALDNHQTECPQMPHSEIIKMMRIMDEIRSIFNIKYPFE